MFENMGNTGRINRYGFECNAERIFSIVVTDMDVTRPGHLVFQVIKKGSNPLQRHGPLDRIVTDLFTLPEV